MRTRFEFAFHRVSREDAARAEVDPTLALLGAQGWEIRAAVARDDGSVLVALQRTLDEEHPLADAASLSSALAEPLVPPSLDELERALPPSIAGDAVGAPP